MRATRGVTLIELTVAMAIIVVLFAAVVYGVGGLTGAKAKESSTELAGVIRSLYDTAALSGKTCRLVFALPGNSKDETAVSYRAECAASGVTAGAKRDDELREASRREKEDEEKAKSGSSASRFDRLDHDGAPSVQELMAREKERVDNAAKFSAFSSDDVPERTLPDNVKVEVWTSKQRDKVKSGPAYLYFFPQGYTERAQVWVRQGNNAWTLTISPLTGKTVIHGEDLEVPR